MIEQKTVTLAMVGAGRAAELHLAAYARVTDVAVRYHTLCVWNDEERRRAQGHTPFETITLDFEALLREEQIDVIDICTPPFLHAEMIERALAAGKHVICEKPLTGYFGEAGDPPLPGRTVSRETMYHRLLVQLDTLQQAVERSDRQFLYAENFVYAPAIQRAADILRAKKSRILFAKGEESLSGSSSPVAGEWSKTGGGTLIRTGCHPLSAILWLKQVEAQARGVAIRPRSVLAEVGTVTPTLSDYEHRHIRAHPVDVEDLSTVVVTFTDQSQAVILATDTLLGGSRNEVALYCNDAAITCTLTLNDLMQIYLLDEDNLADVPLSEMLPQKLGWNRPFVADDVVRGYVNEAQDFIESIAEGRASQSGFSLARDTIRIIYAAYLSAETGRRVDL